MARHLSAVANQVAQLNCGSSPTPNPCNASTALSALDFSGSTSAQLCQLVSVNGSSCANGSLSTPALSASLDALQVLTTEAELANGTSALNVTSALNITGVTSAQLYLTLIQPPQVAFGPVGTTAQTAQLQADLKLSVLGAGLLDIPLTAASDGDREDHQLRLQHHVVDEVRGDVDDGDCRRHARRAGHRQSEHQRLQRPADQLHRRQRDPHGEHGGATPPAQPDHGLLELDPPLPEPGYYSGLSPLGPVFALLTSTLSGVLP